MEFIVGKFYRAYNNSRPTKVEVVGVDYADVYCVKGYIVDPATGKRVSKEKSWAKDGKHELRSSTRRLDLVEEWQDPTPPAPAPAARSGLPSFVYMGVIKPKTPGRKAFYSVPFDSPEKVASFASRKGWDCVDVVRFVKEA